MTEHPNATLFREMFDHMAAGEADKLSALIADDVVYHQIGLPPINGKAALVEAFADFEEMDFEVDIHDVVANDDHTIGLVEATVRAGGQEFSYRTAEIVHVENGKITERWAFSDDTDRINTFFSQFSAG